MKKAFDMDDEPRDRDKHYLYEIEKIMQKANRPTSNLRDDYDDVIQEEDLTSPS